MRQINTEILAKLPTFNELLNNEYGKIGTESREKFNKKALEWFYENP